MDNNNDRKKLQVTRIPSGVNLQDDREQALVYSSKSRCFLGLIPGGRQFLLTENELMQNCTYHDGTKIRPASIVGGRVSTVYYRPNLELPLAAVAQ